MLHENRLEEYGDAVMSSTRKGKDDKNRVTFKEFWALCRAQYLLALPGLLIMIGVLLGVYFLVEWLF
jgi:hypothetical protein